LKFGNLASTHGHWNRRLEGRDGTPKNEQDAPKPQAFDRTEDSTHCRPLANKQQEPQNDDKDLPALDLRHLDA